MKMMQGDALRACSNRSRTRAAPTPTNISTNSAPLVAIERHARLAGHRARQQRLAGARRPDQQDAARDMRAQPRELVRLLQEVDDLVQLVLRLVHAGDIGEGDVHVGFGDQLRAGPADRQQPAAETATHAATPAAHGTRRKQPDADEQKRRQHPGQQCPDRAAAGDSGELDVVLLQRPGEVARHLHSGEVGIAVLHRLGQRAMDHVARDVTSLILLVSRYC